MYLPSLEIESLIFKKQIDFDELGSKFKLIERLNIDGAFSEINWLNTPGPIYTSFTDNCGTGQMEAINNVSGDESYHEVIFKQPVNTAELEEVIAAASCDPFGSYYFDGNLNWRFDTLFNWWDKSEERINYIISLYKDELELPDQPHISSWKIGDKVFSGRLYGPPRPIPENYKSWLDFYQFGLKDYLQWYIYRIEGKEINLPQLRYNWSAREELDNIYRAKFLTER